MSESDDLAKRRQEGGIYDLNDTTPPQNHSGHVTIFAIALARAFGLPHEQIAVIARGAYLHVGKMAIPDAILRKPGNLDPAEITIMREHCYHGYKLISDTPFLAEPAEIVYAHHERYDGSGYPRGLRSSEIPIGARVVAIANTLDVITSDQPYRSAQSFEAAREEIKCWSGRQFDPQIVELFLAMPENVWQNLRKDAFGKSFFGAG